MRLHRGRCFVFCVWKTLAAADGLCRPLFQPRRFHRGRRVFSAAEHGEHVEIAVVDCDSYQFGGYRCPVGTPLYTTPEVHKRMRARSGWEPAGATVDKHRISSAPCKEPGFPAEAPLTKGHSDG